MGYLSVVHDGTIRDMKAGGLVVQLANVHEWNDRGDEWVSTSCSANRPQPVSCVEYHGKKKVLKMLIP